MIGKGVFVKINLLVLLLPAFLSAQDVSLSFLNDLAPKAKEKVEVNLDGSLLQLAAKFLDDKDPDEAKARTLVAGLKGIYVRSYTFSSAGQYSETDVERIRTQLKSWNEIVSVRGSEENTSIYLKSDGKAIQGLVIVSTEPQELTVVNIVGNINPDQVRELSGRFGIPDLSGIPPKKK